MTATQADLDNNSTKFGDFTFLGANYICYGENAVREYKYEWRRYLVGKNFEQIRNSLLPDGKTLRFSFYKKAVVKKVFDVCEMLKLSPEVRYLAVDIFDRFLIRHFFGIADTLEKNENSEKGLWKIVIKRMIKQSFLRILSSVQIASKYHSNYQAISTHVIHEILNCSTRKYCYSRHDIVKSEARILETLEWNVPMVTPLTYIEMFLEDFDEEGLMEYLQLTQNNFLNMCIKVLDVSIFFHIEIFQTFHLKIKGKPFPILKNLQFLSIEADYMYLAASIIHTVAKIQDPSNFVPEKLLKFFSAATQYREKEIELLGSIILNVILNKTR